jgi:Ca-activated chloride channel homolog
LSGGRYGSRLVVLFVLTVLVGALALAYPLLTRGLLWDHAHWQQKWWLLALLLVPFVFWRGTLGEDRRTPRVRMGSLLPLMSAPVGLRVWLRDLPGVMRAAALAMIVASMAQPVSILAGHSREDEGIDIVVVLDMSYSMAAVMDNLPSELRTFVRTDTRGIRPTRLDAAKAVIRSFVSKRDTDRIGVVVFAKDAYVLSPPTLDYRLLDRLVSGMELQAIDGRATAIGDAIGVGAARLRRSDAESKAIILLTDGDNKGGKIAPDYAAQLAKRVGALVYTIQIGDGSRAEVLEGMGLLGPVYRTVDYPVNPALLKKLAETTGGSAYVASDAEALQRSFHDVLDKLEKSHFEAATAHVEDLYRYLLLPGVLLLALEALLRALWLRRFP